MAAEPPVDEPSCDGWIVSFTPFVSMMPVSTACTSSVPSCLKIQLKP